MGRIKTQLIKRETMRIFEEHKKEFTKEFEKNKELVDKLRNIPSKKLRNTIAGYVTRLAKTKQE